MEDQFTSVNADQESVEGSQIEEVTSTEELTQEPQQEAQEESENTSEVADPKPAQDQETNRHYATIRREAERRAAEIVEKERERIRQELHQQYAPVLELARSEAQKYGMDEISWAKAVQQNAERAYYQQLQEQGIDPRVIEQHPAMQKVRQYEQQLKAKEQEMTNQQRFNMEAQELFNEFPDLDAKKIPPEVFELRDKRGLSMLDAYLRVNHKKMIEEATVKAEQSAIKKLSKNATASPGSLSGAGETPSNKVSALSKTDFASLLEKVKRGEIKNL